MIDSKTKLCCIIGNPVEHSLSPQMHNAGYEALGLNFTFLAFTVQDVKTALEGLREINTRGIVVTVPHKIEVMKYIDKVDIEAKEIGAVNTIVNDDGKLIGSNTDWTGALQAIEEKTKIEGKSVALIGAGGAARALAYGLKKRNAKVYVFNRTKEHGDSLAADFKLEDSFGFDELSKIKMRDIIVNTTSVGMHPYETESPVPDEYLSPHHVIFDAVYTPLETKLIRDGKEVGATIVYGDKMVLYGAVGIFEKFTGKKAPLEAMEKALNQELGITN